MKRDWKIVTESCIRKGTGDWNEDGLIFDQRRHLYGVVDGATGIDPICDPHGRSSGRIAMETVVNVFLNGRDVDSLRSLTLEANRTLRTTMREYGVDVSNPARCWGAAHAVVRMRDDGQLEWVQSGDCMIYAVNRQGKVKTLTRDRVKPFDDRAIKRWVEEFGQRRPGGVLPEPIREDLRQNRSLGNTSEGYPVINGGPALEEHLSSGILPIDDLSFLLLVTDGMYPRQGAEEDWVRKMGREGLGKMMEFLYQKEREDKKCTQVPRFKVSDDKAGILIRFK